MPSSRQCGRSLAARIRRYVRIATNQLQFAGCILLPSPAAAQEQRARPPDHGIGICVRRTRWRRRLVRHAADAGVLDDDHMPAQFLPWETSGQVRARVGLPATPAPGRVQLAAWAAIEPYLTDADAESRSLSLTFASRAITSELGRLEDQAASDSHPQPLRWARWRLTSNTLVQGDSVVDTLALFKGADGRILLAAGDNSGTLQIWDPARYRSI